jgi:putative hydrolase of the HAD superfamily
MIEALVFDLDDTLVAEEASAEKAFLETCGLAEDKYGIDRWELHRSLRTLCRKIWFKSPGRAWCVRIGISSWEGLWCRFLGDSPEQTVMREWAPAYRRRSWHDALKEHGVDDEEFARVLAEDFPVRRRTFFELYPDTIPVLEALRGKYRLGLVSNGAPDLQREKIAGAGIGEYFDAIVISGDVGEAKPAPPVFRTVLEHLDVQPDSAVMIGNSLNSDMKGGMAAGMRTVWFNREAKPCVGSVIPDTEIRSMSELPGRLANLEEGR